MDTDFPNCTPATPAEGYAFANWTENGVIVSSNTTAPVTMNVSHALVAHFVPTAAQHTIAATASPAEGGTVTGDGTFSEGTSATLTATAMPGYTFANWTEAGEVVSAEAVFTFAVVAARTLVANFTQQAADNWTISTTSQPVAGGVTSGGGSFSNGTSVTVSAAANAGYLFKRWMEGGTNVSSSASYTFTATNDRTLTAKFAPAYQVSASSDPAAGGSTSGGGWFEDGDTVPLTALPARGYYFVNWTENGTNVSASATHQVKANPDHALTAHFSLILPEGDLAPSTNGGTEIQWPSESELPGWKVEASTNLVDWVEIEDEVEDDGVKKHIQMKFDTKQRFYRTVHD